MARRATRSTGRGQWLNRRTFLAATGLALSASARSLAEPETADRYQKDFALQIADRACLFLDNRFIAAQQGLERSWHPAQPQPQPALLPTEPWEGTRDNGGVHLYGSVLRDPQDGTYKMFYQGYRASLGNHGHIICLAVSEDGKTWTRPKLGFYEFEGSKDNNILLPANASAPNVFLDPQEKDPALRWKMAAWTGGNKNYPWMGHALFGSPDGVHWQHLGKVGTPPLGDSAPGVMDTNRINWDEVGRCFRMEHRAYSQGHNVGYREGRRRAISISSASSLRGPWTPLKIVLRDDDLDDQRAVGMGQDPDKPDWAELYVMPFFNYGNHYIGLLSILHYMDGSDRRKGGGDVQLTFSHDARTWHRQPERLRAIAPAEDAELHACYAMDSKPLVIGNELWVYYTEANNAHPVHSQFISRIRAATWRKDGFVSLASAPKQVGRLTTPPLLFTGTQLQLNFTCSPQGSVRAALLDAGGQILPEYDEVLCDPLTGDATAQIVTWKGRRDLTGLQGKAVRLRLTLVNSRLYSFRFGHSKRA